MHNSININIQKRCLTIESQGLELSKNIYIRVESSRNSRISHINEISPNHPNPPEGIEPGPDVWFPVVDIALEEDMEGVVEFEGEIEGEYSINGFAHPEIHPVDNPLIIPCENLEHWENALSISNPKCRPKSFYLRIPLNNEDGQYQREFNLLSDMWQGRVSLHAEVNGELIEIDSKEITSNHESKASEQTEIELSKEQLASALKEAVEYTLRAQNQNPHSNFYQGLYLFYDQDVRAFRNPHWVWGWGPSIRLLMDAANLQGFEKDKLMRVADEVGRASLRHRCMDKTHIGYASTYRWMTTEKSSNGHWMRLSPSDTMFLAGWAWMPLYERTGEKEYLEATRLIAENTGRLIDQHEIIPQDFYEELNDWQPTTRDEAAFALEGFAEAYRVTGEETFCEIGLKCIDQLIHFLEQDDGMWIKHWNPSKQRNQVPEGYLNMTRGLAWAIEGLLAAARMKPHGPYLDKAKRMADHFVEWQKPDGCWAFNGHLSVEEVGASEKGTAAWAYFMYKLYAACGEEKYLNCARKALKWCLEHMYSGSDPDARGGIPGCTLSSGVTYRQFYWMSCAYTTAFLGLAILEERKKQASTATS